MSCNNAAVNKKHKVHISNIYIYIYYIYYILYIYIYIYYIYVCICKYINIYVSGDCYYTDEASLKKAKIYLLNKCFEKYFLI